MGSQKARPTPTGRAQRDLPDRMHIQQRRRSTFWSLNAPITAISFPVQELGKQAIKILLKGDSNKKHYSNFQVKSDIIERGSVHQVGD